MKRSTHQLCVAPWNVLAAGKIRSDEEEERRKTSGENGRVVLTSSWLRNEDERNMANVLAEVAAEVGADHIQSVAIAYLMHKTTHVFPIVGGRKVEHLRANIEALEIRLSEEHINRIEAVKSFDPGFPSSLIVRPALSIHYYSSLLLNYPG